jgi:long-chain acyl-CoA synthetase
VDQQRKEGSVGQPFTGVEVRLLDDDGRDVAPGEVGEIYKRGVVLSGRYCRNPEATAAIHRGEWVTSHDLGRFDDEGYLYIVDRKKDMIVTGGMNVYPSEVEEILSQHRAVALVAVIGVPDPLWGERVTAFIVPRPGEPVDAEDLRRLCRDGLADYKRPKAIEIVDALPLSPAGKVVKRLLRERLEAECRS